MQENRQLIRYCLQKGYLNRKQLRALTQKLAESRAAGRPRSLWAALCLELGWTPEQALEIRQAACRAGDIDDAAAAAKLPASFVEQVREVASTEEDVTLEDQDLLRMSISEGQSIGAYRLSSKLGAGGMGMVFKAYHPGLRRTMPHS